MAKRVTGFIKLQIEAGKANPAPPIGPALGQRGVNIMEFCKAFNAKTQKQAGEVLPTVIAVYSDRSFSFETKTPPASWLLKRALGVKAGARKPGHDEAAPVPESAVRDVARAKAPDLTAADEAARMRTIEGSVRSMGMKPDYK